MRYYHLVRLSYEQNDAIVNTEVLVLADCPQTACENALKENLITSFDRDAKWISNRKVADLDGKITIHAADVKRVRPDHVRILKVYLGEPSRGPVVQFNSNPSSEQ